MVDYVVYVLFSDKHNKTYVGFTSDLIDRFKSHNFLATKGYTIKFRPWRVIHVEFFDCKLTALKGEKFLKTGIGRAFIRKLVSRL